MIDPVTMLGGSSVAGSVIGLVMTFLKMRGENDLEKTRIISREKKEQNEHTIKYHKTIDGLRDPYIVCVVMLCATYCLAVAICFLCGDIPVATQGFGIEPTETSIAFGLFTRTAPDSSVYLLTFAGLGTYFMSPISYILTVKLTGITTRR